MGKHSSNSDGGVIIIGIGGPSSSGKTTVAKTLSGLFEHLRILHQDDFYKPNDQLPIDTKTGELNWDHPDAIDFDEFKQSIIAIKAGQDLPGKLDSLEPDINMHLTDDEANNLKKVAEEYKGYNLVLVDGFMLFHDEDLLKLFDLKLFYYSDYQVLKTRRSKRQYSTLEGVWVDPPNYFDDIVWPAYENYHKRLFRDNDVNSSLNDYAKQLEIRAYKNNDGSNLKDIITWTLDQLHDYIKHA